MKIIIPDKWDEVTIHQLREISQLDTSNKTKYAIDVLAILSDTDSEDIKKMPPSAINETVKALQFVSELPKFEYKQTITVDGQLYAVNDFSRFTFGQWIDIEELGKNWKENLHKILAVIYLPATEVKGKIKIEPYDGILDERAAIMDKQKVSDVYSASVFFSSFAQQLIADSSLKMLEEQTNQLMKNLPTKKRHIRLGNGIRSWIRFQVNRLSIWRRLRSKTH